MENTVNKEGLLIIERNSHPIFLGELIKIIDSKDKICSSIRLIELSADNIVSSNHVVATIILSLISVEVKEPVAFLEYTALLRPANNEPMETAKQVAILAEHLFDVLREDVQNEDIRDIKESLLEVPNYLYDIDAFRKIIGKPNAFVTRCK